MAGQDDDMHREDYLAQWRAQKWHTSKRGTPYKNLSVRGTTCNFFVIEDRNQDSAWVFAINNQFSTQKYGTKDEAVEAGLSHLATRLQL